MNDRTKRGIALGAIVVFAVLATGCAGVSKPSGWTRPEISGQSLYVSLDRGKLSSLDPATYQLQWEFPVTEEFACGGGTAQRRDLKGIYETPAIDGETLYFGAYDGVVYAVNRSDGACKWRFETGGPIVGGVVFGTEGLYVPSESGFVYLLNPEDGTEIAKFAAGEVWSTPLVTKDAVYVATMEGKLWKLSLGTLEPIWDQPFSVDAALLTPPALVDSSTILVGGIGKRLYAVDAGDGAEKWSVSGKNWFWGPPAVDGTTVYATNLGSEVKAINGTNGDELWTFNANESLRAGVVVAGDIVVAVDNSGAVYRLGADNGELQGQPNELAEGVYATPLLLSGGQGVSSPTASASPAATPASSQAAGATVLIATKSGHLWTLDVTLGRTTEVVD